MENTVNLSRKEREKLGRKLEIQRAAVKLFAEKGFSNTTLEDIAQTSEFGIGTIYNYFQSKEEIFRHIIEAIFEANMEITARSDSEAASLSDFFRLYTRRIFSYFSVERDSLLMLVTFFTGSGERPVHLNPEVLRQKSCDIDEKVMRRIREGVKSGEIRNLNPEYLFYSYHSLVFPYLTHVIKLNKLTESNTEEHADFILDVLFNGILVNKSN